MSRECRYSLPTRRYWFLSRCHDWFLSRWISRCPLSWYERTRWSLVMDNGRLTWWLITTRWQCWLHRWPVCHLLWWFLHSPRSTTVVTVERKFLCSFPEGLHVCVEWKHNVIYLSPVIFHFFSRLDFYKIDCVLLMERCWIYFSFLEYLFDRPRVPHTLPFPPIFE
jgi:hypothetical protein